MTILHILIKLISVKALLQIIARTIWYFDGLHPFSFSSDPASIDSSSGEESGAMSLDDIVNAFEWSYQAVSLGDVIDLGSDLDSYCDPMDFKLTFSIQI